MSSMTQSSRAGIAAQAKENVCIPPTYSIPVLIQPSKFITAMKFLLKMGYSEREYDNLAIEISDEGKSLSIN